MNYWIMAILFCTTLARADFNLQAAIDDAKAGDTIEVPKGTYKQPVLIKKGIAIKGNEATLEVESNNPAILIDSYKQVVIEGLTIKFKSKGKPGKGDSPIAVFVRAGEVALRNCSFEALGDAEQCPGAVYAQDKSELDIKDCRFDGFEYTIQFWNGAAGSVEDCIVMNPGHCGISIGNDSAASLKRNIVTGSRYHGIRCTGGKIEAESNLVVRNKNRGFYIGNKSALGKISNNLIADNATGINVFANSKLEIKNNVIVRSSFAGLCITDTAKLETEGNIIADNEKGVVGFSEEQGKTVTVSISGKNLVHGNKTETEAAELPSNTVKEDPTFSDADSGLFKTAIRDVGLEDPEALQTLWAKWQKALDGR